MSEIIVDGSKITFRDPVRHQPLVLDFGKRLLWASPVDDDIVVAYRLNTSVVMERRSSDSSIRWNAIIRSERDRVSVAPDDLTVQINNVRFGLPGKLRFMEVQVDAIIVVTYPPSSDRDRNLYRYDRNGQLRWQVGDRTFRPGASFTSATRRRDGMLKAEGGPDNLGAIVDFETGRVLRQEDIR
jgi:hypothetical protein